MSASPADLSVVVPSYRSRHLDAVLESAKSLAPLEIIVVDSSPEPPRIADPSVVLIRPSGRVPAGTARNLGAQRARGTFILFLDSDVVLTPRGRRMILEFLRSPDAAFVGGVYDPDQEVGNFASRLQSRIVRHRILRSLESPCPMFSSSHFLARREAFEKSGGFNEVLETYEDFEFCARFLQLGYKLRVSADMEGVHLKSYSWHGLVRDYLTKAFNAAKARRRYQGVFKEAPSRLGFDLAASWIFGAAALATLVIGAFAGCARSAVVGALLFSLFPWFFLRRLLAAEPGSAALRALAAWPFIGAGIIVAGVAAEAVVLCNRARRGTVFIWDLARAAKRVVLRAGGMPVQIVAYVTARCNLRCEHCFYKETLDAPSSGELPLEVFERTTRGIGPVLWFSLGGGEPFVRKDLDKLIAIVQKNCRPKVFSFPTNGWYTERTFEVCLRLLQRMDTGNLILFFSLDGPKDIHDQIRGPGSFDRVKETMARLRPLTRLFPNFYLNVITTVTERNAATAAGFIDELVRDFAPSAISINLFRYHSLNHPPLPESLIEGYRAAVDSYARYLRAGALRHYGFFGGRVLLFKEILQKDLIYRVAKSNEYVTPCTAGTLSYVIMEDGRVSPCEILPDTIGNVTEAGSTWLDMVRSPKAKKLRRWISETNCRCTYECAMSTNTLFSWPMSRKLAKALVSDLIGAA